MVHVHKLSVVFTHSLCYSYLHFTWGILYTIYSLSNYVAVHYCSHRSVKFNITWSWSMFQRTPGTWAQPQTQTGTAPVNEIVTQKSDEWFEWWGTHHCENMTWLLDTLGLHHLEHIHHTLSLTAINGGSYGTEHARPADSVTGERHRIIMCW